MLSRGKRDDALAAEGAALFAHGMDRAMIVQETRVFNETPLRSEKCRAVLSRLLYLLYNTGERLSSAEATSVFFAVTKGFQSRDAHLRKLMYLVVKEMAAFSAQDIIMVISSVTQDMAALPSHRAAAVRVLGAVIDGSLLSGVERVLRQAISDGTPAVASSALSVAALCWLGDDASNTSVDSAASPRSPGDSRASQALAHGREVIRRWLPDAQAVLQAATGSGPGMRGPAAPMAQFHALALLYLVKQGDRGALAKLVAGLHGRASNPHAAVLLVRIHGEQLAAAAQHAAGSAQPLDLLPVLARAKGGLAEAAAAVEAARLVCKHAGRLFGPDVVAAAVSAMQSLLGSGRPIFRHAAIRVLATAVDIPGAREHVVQCNPQLEAAAGDSNRTVATLAIATLLRTGEEASVDRLLSQISAHVADIADDFRVVVVDAVRALARKFPAKHKALLTFLGGTLLHLESGGLAFKEATVDAITEILARVPAAREDALGHLCEFIEDCEFPRLTAAILHVLGDEGARSEKPARLVRFIYNRLALEDAAVRSAAVGALAKIALASSQQHMEQIVADISAMLSRTAAEDADDDVRDRAIVAVAALASSGDSDAILLLDDRMPDLDALDARLDELAAMPESYNGHTSLLDGIPLIERDRVFEEARAAAAHLESASGDVAGIHSAAAPEAHQAPVIDEGPDASALADIPQIAALGELLVSGAPVALTNADAEFVVTGRTHLFAAHIVVEFSVRNTVPELLLESAVVAVRHSCAALEPLFVLPIASLPFDAIASCYVAYRIGRGSSNALPEASMACSLRFTMHEIDPSSGARVGSAPSQDEFALGTFELSSAAYIRTRDAPDFDADALSLSAHMAETLELPDMPSVHAAVQAVVAAYGLQPLHGTAFVSADPGTKGHVLLLAGKLFVPSKSVDPALFSVRARFALVRPGTVAVEMDVRAQSSDVCDTIIGVVC